MLKLDAREVVEARERLGLTQEELATRAEVSENTVLRAEHGLEVRPVTARRLARGLGVEVADLYPKDHALGSPPKETERARRIRLFDMVHDTRVRQNKAEGQALARLEESKHTQPISMRAENESFKELVQLPVDQLADLVQDTMEYAVQKERRVDELEQELKKVRAELAQEKEQVK